MGRADGARRRVRDEHDRGARRADAGVRQCSAVDARRVGAGDAPRRQALRRVRGRALHLRRRRRFRALARRRPRRHVRRATRRPRRLGDAQLPRVGDRLLGDHRPRCGGRRDERLVDAARDGVRPRRLPPEGADRRRRTRRAGDAGARRPARRCAAAARGGAHRPRPARRCRALGRRRAAGGRAGGAAGGRHRSRRRRHDLLHVGDHRLPQGCADHPSRLGPQRPRPRVLDAGHGEGRGQGDRCWRPAGADGAARATSPARVHGPDAALPRHGVQLHPAPVHARRWSHRADASLGRRAGARADRA